MQEKLARLHFSLNVCGEEEDEEEEDDGVTEGLPEEQKKTMADRNLDQLLSNVGHKTDCLGSGGTKGLRRGHRFPTLPVKVWRYMNPRSVSSSRSTNRASPEYPRLFRVPS